MWWFLIVLVLVLVAYFLPHYGIRAHLKATPQFALFYADLEARERGLWERITARLKQFWLEVSGLVIATVSTVFDPTVIADALHLDLSAWISASWQQKLTQALGLLLMFAKLVRGRAA